MKPASALIVALALGAAPLAAQQLPPTPPPPTPVQPAPFPPYQEATLPNGLHLVLVARHQLPVVSLSLSLPAGSYVDPAGKEGLAGMAAGLLTKGAGSRTADEIAAEIEGVGGHLDAGAGQDFLTVSSDVLSSSAPLAFELVSDAVMRPTFPAQELELQRTRTLSALQLELSQPASLASRFFDGAVYGATPYARHETPASVRAITRDDLLAFRKARLVPRGAMLVIAGDMTLADAKALATKYFGSWQGAPAPAPALGTPPARTRTEILLVNRPGSVQSNIVVGNATFLPTDRRYTAAAVANKVLGGGADGRLFTILREQKSWTYGAYSSLDRPRGIGTFQATAEVRTPVTDSALSEMLAQLRRIRTQPIPAAELAAAKGSMVGSFPLTMETAQQVARAVALVKELGLPDDYLKTYRTRIGAVTAAQAAAAARAAIRPDAEVIVVVGDGSALYGKLKAIAPVGVVAPDGTPVPAAQLSAAPSALDLDLSKLVARSDSFTIDFQGRPLGWQKVTLEKTADGFRYTAESQIGAQLRQQSVLLLDRRATLHQVTQRGTVQGQALNTDLVFDGGRVKGTAAVPSAMGIQTVSVDTTVPAGVTSDEALGAIFPALRWAPGARWTIPSFSPTAGGLRQLTLAVTGTDTVTVPAGTFPVYRAELTMPTPAAAQASGNAPAQQTVMYYVTISAPHRLVKVVPPGPPLEVVLEK